MSVSNYLSKSEYGCRYKYNKLKSRIYLISEEQRSKIYIDNGEAYVSGITGEILKVEGNSVEYKEETSIDERYKFQKSFTLGINGIPEIILYRWANLDPNEDYWCEEGDKYYKQQFEQYIVDIFKGYYFVIETSDGTFYLVNPDYSAKFTYTYNLSNGVNRTDFSFSALSNFPALELRGFNPPDYFVVPCKNYILNGVDDLKMLETDYTMLSNTNKKVLSSSSFKTVEYLGKTLSFREEYDGSKFTTTVEFQIAFDGYKTSWHYNLLEFLENKYAAIIEIKSIDKFLYTGFNSGLQPNYSIQTTNGKDQSDIITITLTEITDGGSIIDNYAEEINTATNWRYISKIGNDKAYECIGNGVAKYLLQEECDFFGKPTGNYKALSGYSNMFPDLNITGTFNNVVTFYNPQCK